MKCYKNIIVIICFFVFACVKVAWADSYTITFKTGNNYGVESTTATSCSDLVTAGADRLSGNLVTATKVFNGDEYGLRLGTSSSSGVLKMNLSAFGTVVATSIVVNARRYNTTKEASLSVNGSANQAMTGTFQNYTYNITGMITYLELVSTKYVYISSITVNYTAGVSHTLSSAVSPAGSGSVSPISTTLSENGIAEVTAASNLGYAFDHWSISGTGASLSSTSANPTTVTMGTANATVTAHFTALSAHTVTFNAGTGTCATTSLTESVGGEGVVLPEATAPAGCDPEYHFYGWATAATAAETSTAPDIVGIAGETYHPDADVDLYAVYMAGGYVKVESTLADFSGRYLIVYEAGNKVFDGSRATLDVSGNNVVVPISGNVITANSTTDAMAFIITKVGSNYTIKSSSNIYIGNTSDSNDLDESPSIAYVNAIAYNGVSANVVSSGGAYMRFNTTDNRFRYYKSATYTGQQPIQLYRKEGASVFCSNPSCTCPAPSDFTVSSITSSSAYLMWTAGGSETQWQLVYSDSQLGDPTTGTINNLSHRYYDLTSLTPLTTYYVYLRSKCSESDFSGWREIRFNTPCVDWSPGYSLNNTSATLEVGRTLALALSGSGGRAVVWSTSNSGVATVVDGVVTAVAEGHCVISATVAAVGTDCEKRAICNVHVYADQCIRVGWSSGTFDVEINGIGTHTTSDKPNSYTQQLYTANEIRMAGGRAGKITGIKINHEGSFSTNSDIYIGLTSQNDLADGWVTEGLQQIVANQSISYATGWTEISIPNLEWDGESNIVLAFRNRSQSGSGACVRHLLGAREDPRTYTYNYRYSSWTAAQDETMEYNAVGVPNTSSDRNNHRTNVRFCITPCDNPLDAYFAADQISTAYGQTINLASQLVVNPRHGSSTIIEWSSDNPSVATVDASGEVSTHSTEGTAIITAHLPEASFNDSLFCSTNAYIAINVCNCPVNYDLYKIGTSTTSGRTAGPVDAFFKYGYRQIIYEASELTPGKIKSITFDYASSNTITRNITIYMGHTMDNSFSDASSWIPLSVLTQVYNGSFEFSHGLNKIDLNSDFSYNGCGNLVIAIDDNTGSAVTGTDALDKFYYSSSSKVSQLYKCSDDSDLSPSTPPNGTLASNYPNIRFCIDEDIEPEHTLSYVVDNGCSGTVMPLSIPSVDTLITTVTTIVPSCSNYAGFVEWNTEEDGSGESYYSGDRINLSCGNITLYAIYDNVVHGESSCENAVAFCSSDNSLTFHVEQAPGVSYGNFCAYFNTPATWWYMQIAEPGDINMTISSSSGDVDFACWGPFDNMTCDLADISDNGAGEWKSFLSDAQFHRSNADISTATTMSASTPICGTHTLAEPCGNLIDFGGSSSHEEYLQIEDAMFGEFYMILVANYANSDSEITFYQTSGSGRASCDVVSNCDITSISASPTCMNSYSYKVSGEVAFRDAPIDGTLTVELGSNTLTFTPPFASPIAFEFTGLTPNGASMSITATFESSTVNCSKITSYVAPTKDYCKDVFLPVTLLNLRGECNGKRALISWTTASEHNNDYFVVERSDDAVNFVEVGRVAGAGNSIEMLSYNYADYSIRTGENYYRLTQVDYDGTRTTSEIIEVHCSGNVPLGDPDVYVYPNPFGDELTVHLVNFGDVAAHIQVYDMLGRMLFKRTADDTEVVLQLGALPDAAYTVRVSTADFVVNKKVVKNN